MGLTRKRHRVTLQAMTVIHANCVKLEGVGVLIRGSSGAGKSDLTLRLIDEGADLVADDYCHLTAENGVLTAGTPQAIAGKIEVRGYGIVTVPYVNQTAVALVINLTEKSTIERMPEHPTCVLEGIEVTQARLDPTSPSASARVRLIAASLKNKTIAHEKTA